MSVFTETKTPYEFLARWENGILKGAHVGFINSVLKDGVAISSTPENVQSVTIGQQNGFPLADILSQIQIDALVDIERLTNINLLLNNNQSILIAENERLNILNQNLVNEIELLNSEL